MSDVTTSKEFKDVVKNLNTKQFDIALNSLSKLSTIHPNDYYILKLFASIYFKKASANHPDVIRHYDLKLFYCTSSSRRSC